MKRKWCFLVWGWGGVGGRDKYESHCIRAFIIYKQGIGVQCVTGAHNESKQ